jgi:hypothetical protein
MHKAARDPLATNPKAPVAEMCFVSEKNKWKKKNKELWLAWMWDRTGAKEKSGQLLGSKDEAHDSRNKSRVPEKISGRKKTKNFGKGKIGAAAGIEGRGTRQREQITTEIP